MGNLQDKNLLKVDLCVLGAGSAGLSVAAGAVQMGASVALIEGGQMGGDCLNTGCVPSKSLLSAAHAVHHVRSLRRFGIKAHVELIDFQNIYDHVHNTIAQIAPHDSQERFEQLGCHVIRHNGRFLDEKTVLAGGIHIRARRFVIATGSRPALPPLPGLTDGPFLTNETVFELTTLPDHVLVLGGGPIGTELSQAFCRLGAKVTMLVRSRLLPKDDPDAVEILRDALVNDGITVMENCLISRVHHMDGKVSVELQNGDLIHGSHLLVATGRQANIESLDLHLAGIETTGKGIQVDARLRTCNPRVFAAGDVIGGPQFTHWAGYHAGIIIRNALFRLPAKVSTAALPRVTYTEPELAQVGRTESEAKALYGDKLIVLHSPFADNDRAKAEANTTGFAKVMVTPKGRIIGATLIGAQAGDLCQIWGLAISSGQKIGAIAGMIAPYPTRGEVNKRVAGGFYTPKLFSKTTKWLVKALSWLG